MSLDQKCKLHKLQFNYFVSELRRDHECVCIIIIVFIIIVVEGQAFLHEPLSSPVALLVAVRLCLCLEKNANDQRRIVITVSHHSFVVWIVLEERKRETPRKVYHTKTRHTSTSFIFRAKNTLKV